MNAQQLRSLIKTTLTELQEATDGKIQRSEVAEDLLMMTAAHESHLGEYIKQVGGPALGIFQMEPATEDDIWDNYLHYRPDLETSVDRFYVGILSEELVWNLKYAIVMARVHYYRIAESLPAQDDEFYLMELARYCKYHYNTQEGKATKKQYYDAYINLILLKG